MADRDLTQAQLEELVVGKKENPRAVFFEKAKLNVEKSKEAGRRCYDKLTYVKKTAPGLTDYASALATPKDIMDYPEEYEYFMQNKQGTREPGIEMIPGLDILHLTELRDYGLLTIRKLAEANSVPVHLKAAQDAAIRIQATLAKENESGKEENTSKEIQQEVPATDRSSDAGHIGQPAVSSSEGNRSREVGEGLRSGGPIHNSQSIDNWSVSFRM